VKSVKEKKMEWEGQKNWKMRKARKEMFGRGEKEIGSNVLSSFLGEQKNGIRRRGFRKEYQQWREYSFVRMNRRHSASRVGL
jgi:hypothetical protein